MYNYGYNAMSPYQQQSMQNRLNQMEQQYNNNMGMYQQGFQQQTAPQMQQVQIIKGRPVSSMDEAKASMIDLDGSLFVFPDIANKCIYTKQIMLDGSAEFKTYRMQETANSAVMREQGGEQEQYVLRKDFEKGMQDLNNKLESFKKEVMLDADNDKPNVAK